MRAYRYPLAVRVIHWLGVAAIAIAYLTGESAEDLAEGAPGGSWHVLAGIGLVLLFVPRLAARMLLRERPSAVGAERWMAATLQLALLLFTVVQPMLGVLALWSGGHALPIPFTAASVPPLLQLQGMEHALGELHETVGNVFYGVIALHALAALWHQFVRRDGVLQRMLW